MKRLSDEELINLAKDGEDTDEGPLPVIQMFINDLGIVTMPRGTGGVKSPIIYWVFLKWCKERDFLPYSRVGFFMRFKKALGAERGIKSRTPYRQVSKYYFVNKEPFKLDRDEELEALYLAEKEIRWRKQARKKKKYKPLKEKDFQKLSKRNSKKL